MLVKKREQARRCGIEFNITEADLDWPTHCPVTGVELRYDGAGHDADDKDMGFKVVGGRRGPRADAAVFNRIDNTRGYVRATPSSPCNVWIISYAANTRKGDLTKEQFERLIAVWPQSS
jgi:hypothetical protein